MLKSLRTWVAAKTLKIQNVMNSLSAKAFVFGVTAVGSSVSMAAAPSASDTNTSAAGATAYIIGILQGEIGYLLALAAFVAGIFSWFKTKDLMQTLSCFGLAVAIIIVPGALNGFFS